MEHDFWELLPGMIVLGLLGIGFFGAILMQVFIGLFTVFVTIFGIRETAPEAYSTVRIKHYDMDEDY
jgi:hypothetical protein